MDSRTNIEKGKERAMNSNIDGNAKFKDWGDQWFRRKKLDFSLSYAKTALNHLKNINSFIGDIPISKHQNSRY
ncbi:MAG: hypothetical protein ACQGTM_06080 [bacterium]|jgi:hypothetical protein